MTTVDKFLRIQAPENRKAPQSRSRKRKPPTGSAQVGNGHRLATISTPDILQLRSRPIARAKTSSHNSSSNHSGASDGSLNRKPKGHHQRRYKRPFRKRIYEAAVASYVDPIATLAQPKDTPVSKPSLRFEPVTPQKVRRGRVVGLARGSTLKSSSFSHPSDSNKVKLPLTRWKPILSSSHLQNGSTRAQNKAREELDKYKQGRQETQSCFPLSFIPLSQAEGAYKTMFPPRGER